MKLDGVNALQECYEIDLAFSSYSLDVSLRFKVLSRPSLRLVISMYKLLGPTWIRGLLSRPREWASGDVRAILVAQRLWLKLLSVSAVSLLSIAAPAQTPGCVPFTANYPCVYVVNSSDFTVSVVNANTNAIISTLPVGVFPVAIALTPDNAFAYVANNSDASVSVIDTRAGLVAATVTNLSGTPTQVAVTPDGKFVYVVGLLGGSGQGFGFLNVIDTSTNQLVPADTLTSFQNPTGIAFAPSPSTFAYVADTCNAGTNNVVACAEVFDASQSPALLVATIQIPGTFSFQSTGSGIAVSPDGSLVCMTVSTSANLPNVEVAFIQTSNNTFLNLLPIEDNAAASDGGLAITPGGILYASAQSITTQSVPASIFPITLSSQTIGTPIQVGVSGEESPGIALGSNGAWLYATNLSDSTVSVVNTAASTVNATIPVGNAPIAVAAMSLGRPSITTQPASQGVTTGQTATLNVVAANIAPLGYQWYQGQSGDTSAPIAGATAPSFTTPALTATTSYWVAVVNIAGVTDSSTAVVTVALAPSCTLSIAGSAPPDFLTISANVSCTDPQGLALITIIDWGDSSSTTTGGGSVTVTHTYAEPAIYQIVVTTMDSLQLQGQVPAFVVISSTVDTTTPPVFAGQSSDSTISLDGAPANLQVSFECTTVTDSSGTVSEASDLGIECSSNPPVITFTGAVQNVAIGISTTGAASGSLAPTMRHRNVFYALLMPLPAFLLLLGVGTQAVRSRRVGTLPYLALGFAMTILLITSCGGGFKALTIVQQSTPAGTYQVTVIDQPLPGQSTTGFVQTSLILPLTVEQVQ